MEFKYMGNDIFKYVKNGSNRYIELRHCETCGNPFYTDKYNKVEYCSSECVGNRRGRPIGYKLSDYSKRIISKHRTGKTHSIETVNKIKKAVKETCNVFNEYRDYGANRIHGETLRNSYLYRKWQSLISRCCDPNNKNYIYYGARGIKVSEVWREYLSFKNWIIENDWEKGMHLHRIDVDGDYGPDNCTILTPSEHSKLHAKLRRENE